MLRLRFNKKQYKLGKKKNKKEKEKEK